ncbi:MAG TPA: Rieske 2Fe-2S domain-containing protein [Gammaproteobacteria bacterium]|nr:Rieske 2Fe-2S domain-containing protein [Gammaproteobacteria bacterium]
MIELCTLARIPDPGTYEFSWGEGSWPLSLFIVRRGDSVFGFVNRCPHAGHELNLLPNEFLTSDGELLMCRSHGARFRIDDGLCVLGPCPGALLPSFAVTVIDGTVVTERAELDRVAERAGR